jgi:hypothetical protein
MDWIVLPQDTIRWRAVVDTVMQLAVSVPLFSPSDLADPVTEMWFRNGRLYTHIYSPSTRA